MPSSTFTGRPSLSSAACGIGSTMTACGMILLFAQLQRPMSRQRFICLFVTLAVCFVPILINFGVVAWIVPTCWGLASTLREVVDLDWRPTIGFGLYSVIYLVAFYIIGRILYFLIGLARHIAVVWSLQLFVLIALFSCSFLRVLTYGSIQGRGGTYTFWTAAERFMERRAQR